MRSNRSRSWPLREAVSPAPRRCHPTRLGFIAFVLFGCVSSAAAQGCQPFKVLVFSKTAGFRHDPQISLGAALIQTFGTAHGFVVDHTEDATLINATNLAQYAAVIFLHTTGDILNAAQEAAFEGYITGGGGFVGVHSATDTEYTWPFYGALIGTWFLDHPPIQVATLDVTDPNHPSTATLPPSFSHTDEWYNFQTNVSSNPLVTVLMTVDENTYTGGSMGPIHPIAWYQDPPGMGRSWYTALGHDLANYTSTLFQDHLLGGILWAADSLRTRPICGGQAYGAGSGLPVLTLAGSQLSATSGAITLSGAAAGGVGLLGVSACDASATSGSLTILIGLGMPGLLGLAPIAFDSAGQWQTTIPLTLQLPGAFGTLLHLQGAQIAPSIGLSNGLQLVLCP